MVETLFVTADVARTRPELLAIADIPVAVVSVAAAAGLSETVSPQGLVAVCRDVAVPIADAFGRAPRLAVGLVEANDPGNAGTILRTADAAGAGLVAFADDGVDPYNGKAVRAGAGSLFHLDVVVEVPSAAVIVAARSAGLQVLATTGRGDVELDDLIDAGGLTAPTLWLMGNEARGLPDDVLAAADLRVRVPLHGRAESLNLSAAAAVCLYASARAHRR